jgi:hypothetical protein
VRIASDVEHRALAYVDAVQRNGYLLHDEEFDAYMKRPERRTVFSAALARVNVEALFLDREMPLLARLEWLGWIDSREFGAIAITRLGRAVLAALDEDDRAEDLPTEIVLDPVDELSYARVIGAIHEAGPAALVDAYFKLDHLLDIVQRTEVARILIHSDRDKSGRLPALQQAVNTIRLPRRLEIRISDEFHDRFVIPDFGSVRFIGTSLSGIGRRLAITGTIKGEAASNALRDAFERVWTSAEVLVAAEPEGDEPEPADEAASA